MEKRLRELLASGNFVSMKTFLENHLATGQTLPELAAPASPRTT
jgi:hypothetical protein